VHSDEDKANIFAIHLADTFHLLNIIGILSGKKLSSWIVEQLLSTTNVTPSKILLSSWSPICNIQISLEETQITTEKNNL